jgi:hypothetical protein
MLKKAIVIAFATALTSSYGMAFAQGRGGGGTTGGSNVSGSAAKNSNSPSSADRDKGLARAEDRRSKEGAEHEKADRAHSKVKRHTKATQTKR